MSNRHLCHICSLGLIAVMSLACVAACSADIKFVDEANNDQNTVFDYAHVEITGEIVADDLEQLPALLEIAKARSTLFKVSGKPPRLLVVMNSKGGDIITAMKIGRYLRNQNAMVWVRGECSSACIFILAGGVERYAQFEPKLGIHRPRFGSGQYSKLDPNQAKQRYDNLIEQSRSYLVEMGLSSTLMDFMLRIPSQKVEYIGRKEAEAYGVLGEAAGYAEWERANLVEKYGPLQLEIQDRYIDCLDSGKSNEDCGELH